MSMKNLTLAGAALGLLLAGAATAGAQDRSGRTPAAPQAKASCLALDENGRTLPNPNASYGCFQLEALRNDCETLAKQGNTRALALHCFGYEPAPQVTTPSAYSSHRTAGSGANSR